MNIGRPLSGFLPLSGGTLTGALTISANVSPLLTIIRPDAAAAVGVQIQSAGVSTARINTDEGRMTLGIVPLARMRRTEATGGNAGLVTILAAQTTIATVALGTVQAGDRINVAAYCHFTGAAGVSGIIMAIRQNAGTATIAFPGLDASYQDEEQGISAGNDWVEAIAGDIRVTVAGTLTLELSALAVGGNPTVAIGAGGLIASVLNDG